MRKMFLTFVLSLCVFGPLFVGCAGLEPRVAHLEGQVGGLSAGLAFHGQRLGQAETDLAALRGGQEGLAARVSAVETRVDKVASRADAAYARGDEAVLAAQAAKTGLATHTARPASRPAATQAVAHTDGRPVTTVSTKCSERVLAAVAAGDATIVLRGTDAAVGCVSTLTVAPAAQAPRPTPVAGSPVTWAAPAAPSPPIYRVVEVRLLGPDEKAAEKSLREVFGRLHAAKVPLVAAKASHELPSGARPQGIEVVVEK